jgi:hypothetical protein
MRPLPRPLRHPLLAHVPFHRLGWSLTSWHSPPSPFPPEAEKLYRRALEISNHALGEEHSATLNLKLPRRPEPTNGCKQASIWRRTGCKSLRSCECSTVTDPRHMLTRDAVAFAQ